MSRSTIRLRLTLLYGALFLISGTVLLVVTYLLLRSTGILVLTKGPPDELADLGDPRQRAGELHGALVRELLLRAGIALAVMAVLSIGLGWLIAGRVLRPLRTIISATQDISANSLHQRLNLTGPDDELKELSDTIDALLVRLESAFDAQRRFVANASHELRTPLARQRTLLEVALADPMPTVVALQATCRRALVAGAQQEKLIEALLVLARSQRGLDGRDPVDLAGIARSVLSHHAGDVTVTSRLHRAMATGDAALMERLVVNLIDNASRHNVPGGWIDVSTGYRGGRAVLSVANSGPMIPEAEIGRLFQPFRRLHADRTSARSGNGLGLSIVDAVARAHGAAVHARALRTGGLEIEVHFVGPDPAPVAVPDRPTAAAAAIN